MLEKELEIKDKIKIYAIGPQKVIIEMVNFNDKITILKEKKRLKDKNLYIDSEMTKKERKIQKELSEIARDERKNKGSMVKIGFQKIAINNVMMKWDINERTLGPR
ncbi:hypothetical protein Zmor_026939 [Zophobas morio]|uniref:Uncharacterized protein n=1 Tax=Zophobas morio TaxID=2755281 RepID=A0AA38M600_9CUCU|nr:hypothetical protein Zmor_026939 [Zophobas morio]